MIGFIGYVISTMGNLWKELQKIIYKSCSGRLTLGSHFSKCPTLASAPADITIVLLWLVHWMWYWF